MNPGLLFGLAFLALLVFQYSLVFFRYKKNKSKVDLLIRVIEKQLIKPKSVFGLLSHHGKPHHILTGVFDDYQVTCNAWKITEGSYQLTISAAPKEIPQKIHFSKFLPKYPKFYLDFEFNGSAVCKTITLDSTFQSEDAKNLLQQLKQACNQIEQGEYKV